MTTLDDFTQLNLFLQEATSSDSLLALASTFAWLNPLAVPAIQEEIQEEAQAECELARAFLVIYDCFPDLYLQVICAVRQHTSYEAIKNLIINTVNRRLLGPGITALEEFGFWIPNESTAVAIFDPTFDCYADSIKESVITTLSWFGVVYDEEIGGIDDDLYRDAGHTAEMLALSLREQHDRRYDELAMLLEWVFARTGNTLADCTEDELCEFGLQPPDWTPHDIELHNAIQSEAYEIMEQAQNAYRYLSLHPALIPMICTNIQKILPAVQQWKKGRSYDEFTRLAPRLAAGCEWTKLPPDDDECHPTTDPALL